MSKFQANVVYPDGRVNEVKNLGYLLRNWMQVHDIHVSSFEQDPAIRGMQPDAFMSVDFDDGRTYTTGFMDRGILGRWLDRPVFRGLMVNWFGEDLLIGTDTLV